MVDKVNKMEPQPAFFVLGGDMLDAFPEQWPEIRKKQEQDFMEVFKDLRVPFVCFPGNHDLGQKPTEATIASYKKSFGDDYFSFWHGGVHFIVLNSQYYENCSMTQTMANEQDQWLDVELAKPAVHKIIFQHIPWFIHDPMEEKVANLQIEMKTRHKMLRKLKEAGVRKVFCGHCHQNSIGWYDDKSIEVVVTAAIGVEHVKDGHGFRLIKVTKDDVTHQYYRLEDAPSIIKQG